MAFKKIPILLTDEQFEMLRILFKSDADIQEALAEQVKDIILAWVRLSKEKG